MPRPKTTPIDLLRTKAWAHACARIIGDTEQATTYRLSLESTSFLKDRIESLPAGDRDTYPKSIDNGRWSRWLRGLRGVERKIVLALDDLCPGAAKVYDIGPEAGPWIEECGAILDFWQEELYTKHLKQTSNLPLWAAMKGNSGEILSAWKSIPLKMWISWTPNKLRLTDAWMEYQLINNPPHLYDDEDESEPNNHKIDYSDGDPIADKFEYGKRIKKPKQQFIYTPDKWSWWKPREQHFSSFAALNSFLWRYIDGPTSSIPVPDTHPLLSFVAMLSINVSNYDQLGWSIKSYLKDFLAPFGLSIDEILAKRTTVFIDT